MKLAPCPFCGFEGVQMSSWQTFQVWHATCPKCGANGSQWSTADAATAAWNTRHPTHAPSALAYLEALHAHANAGTANDPTGARGGTAMLVHRAYEAHRQAGCPVYVNNPETSNG